MIIARHFLRSVAKYDEGPYYFTDYSYGGECRYRVRWKDLSGIDPTPSKQSTSYLRILDYASAPRLEVDNRSAFE
jgi:hypothetical protein